MTPTPKNPFLAFCRAYIASRSYLTLACIWMLIAGMGIVLANTLAASY